MRIALIANPGSGQGASDRVADLLEGAGATVASIPIEEAGTAAGSRPERIVVAGGDGSIGAAASVAGELGVPLAVVACGTANDFAQHLELPSDLEAACELAVSGTEIRRMELARVDGRPFVNVAGAGLAPAAAEEAAGLKERLGPLAYPVGAVGAGLSQEPIGCEIDADGVRVFEGDAWQVSIASSGAFGGGSSFVGDTSDGRLDLVVIEGSSRARLLKHAYGLRVGVVEDQAGVLSVRASKVELAVDPAEGLNIDGELIAARDLAGDGVLDFGVTRSGYELVTG